MASVGGIDVTSWGGRMPYPQRGVGVIPGAPGVDGDGVLYAAKKTRSVTIATGVELAGDKFAGDQLADRYRALATPTPISLVDSLGKTWQNVVVISVIAEVTVLAITNRVRVDCVWVFKVPITGPTPASGAT